MARELGMNPTKLGKLANCDQQPWKAPLAAFIEDRYQRTFGRACPESVKSIEERFGQQQHRGAVKPAIQVAAPDGSETGTQEDTTDIPF